jgi:hypothetical protein
MEEHNFDVMCPSALFMETATGQPEHEKLCVDVSHPGRIGMHCVTRRSHQMQRHMFDVTCPGLHFVISVVVPTEQEK